MSDFLIVDIDNAIRACDRQLARGYNRLIDDHRILLEQAKERIGAEDEASTLRDLVAELEGDNSHLVDTLAEVRREIAELHRRFGAKS